MLDITKKIYTRFLPVAEENTKEFEDLGIPSYRHRDGFYYLEIDSILSIVKETTKMFIDLQAQHKEIISHFRKQFDDLQKEIDKLKLEKDNLKVNINNKKENLGKELMIINNNIILLKEQITNKENELKSISIDKIANLDKNIFDVCKADVMKRIDESFPEINKEVNSYLSRKLDEMFKEKSTKVGLLLNKVETNINNPQELTKYLIKLVSEVKDVNGERKHVISPKELESARDKLKEVISEGYKEELGYAIRCLDNYMDSPIIIKGVCPTGDEAKLALRKLLWRLEGLDDSQDDDKKEQNRSKKQSSETSDDTQIEENDKDIVNNGDLDVLEDD